MSRYARQSSVVPDEILQKSYPVIIVGVGAIGRQVALQLAAAGVRRFMLFDDDVIEETNIVTQGYHEEEIGRYKVEALTDAIRKINSDTEITSCPHRFSANTARETLQGYQENHTYPWSLFSCVDSITSRKIIWNVTRKYKEENKDFEVGFMADGRMTAESMRVITCVGLDEKYEETLFEQSEAHQGPCTARGTLFCANVCAGLMVSAFTKYLRRMQFAGDSIMNLFTTELTTEYWPV